VRTNANGAPGAFTPAMTFTIGADVTLDAPVAIWPTSGATTDQTPVLTVTNVTRTGPTGVLSYRFEIGSDATFSSTVAAGSVTEGLGTTSFKPSPQLAAGSTYAWRARVIDPASQAMSPYSTVQTFATLPAGGAAMVTHP
jgi:hypothetical protein